MIGHPKRSNLIAIWLFHCVGKILTHFAHMGHFRWLVTLVSSSKFPGKILKYINSHVLKSKGKRNIAKSEYGCIDFFMFASNLT